MQIPHTFQYPKVTPVAQAGTPKPATPASTPRPQG
jgi:hypothetical protein